MRHLSALLAFLCVMALPTAARAACSATVTDLNFGAVSVRAGASNQTSGHIEVRCTGILLPLVGICVRFGPGSGGAAAGNSPRYMRRSDGSALDYQIRPLGFGPSFGTFNAVYLNLPILLGTGSTRIPIFADITSGSVSVGTGTYSSTFSGVNDVRLSYGVLSCDLLGTTVPVPDFSVTADVVPSCELDVTAMDFGAISTQLSANVDSQATVNVRCTSDTSYSISLDNGNGAGATGPTARKMTNLGHTLSYGLYQNAGRSQPWGDQPGNTVAAVGAGGNQAFTVYGRIFAGQAPRFGFFRDSVVVTVNY